MSAPLVWSRTPPTVPGWWWYRTREYHDGAETICRSMGTFLVYPHQVPFHHGWPPEAHVEFAGPLSVPAEPAS